MRRIPIQIDDKTYAALRLRAFQEKRSIASIVRECLRNAENPQQQHSATSFSFVASGASTQRPPKPVSSDHDRALAEALVPPRRPRRK